MGLLGVALAFGLTVLTMAYAVGHVSGGHFKPAVTVAVAVAVARRFPWRDVPAYVITQVVVSVVAASVLYVVASGAPGFNAKASGFAANGFGAHSPGKYCLGACLVAEVVLTAFFLYVILGATDGRAPVGFAPIAIGLALTLIHLISIPVTNASVNPARSTGVAIFAGSWRWASSGCSGLRHSWALRSPVPAMRRSPGTPHRVDRRSDRRYCLSPGSDADRRPAPQRVALGDRRHPDRAADTDRSLRPDGNRDSAPRRELIADTTAVSTLHDRTPPCAPRFRRTPRVGGEVAAPALSTFSPPVAGPR